MSLSLTDLLSDLLTIRPSGILPVCQDDDGLAAVLVFLAFAGSMSWAQLTCPQSHEIAHTIARHSAERMSKYFLIIGGFMLASILSGIDPGPFGRAMIDLALLRPGSRKQEAEARIIIISDSEVTDTGNRRIILV